MGVKFVIFVKLVIFLTGNNNLYIFYLLFKDNIHVKLCTKNHMRKLKFFLKKFQDNYLFSKI